MRFLTMFLVLCVASCGAKKDKGESEGDVEPLEVYETPNVPEEAAEQRAEQVTVETQSYDDYHRTPSWFDPTETLIVANALIKEFNLVIPAMGCSGEFWGDHCEATAQAHNTLARLANGIQDPEIPWQDVLWAAKTYYEFNYSKFREAYGSMDQNKTAEARFHEIVRQSLLLAQVLRL